MAYLRHKTSGAITDSIDPESHEYRALAAQRNSTTGQSVWEDVGEDVASADPAGGRVVVIRTAPAATASAETTTDPVNPQEQGTITDIEFVPDADITGVATNNRVITLQSVTVSAAPARVVANHGSITFSNGVNAKANQAVALTLSATALPVGSQLQVVSSVNGTGLADPGGVVYAVYTRV